MDVNIVCPRFMISDVNSFNFMMEQQRIIDCPDVNSIKWDMTNTKVFETNLLSMLSFIFEKAYKNQKQIYIFLPNGFWFEYKESVIGIFNYYSQDKKAFFKPRKVGYRNVRETEDVIIKYLRSLKLKEYAKIKILISEMIANIKMHTIYKEGVIAGDYLAKLNQIVFSIANYDYSIKKQLLWKRGLEFSSDFEAIVWCLRKSNSSRNDEESGGLGLYLLRKYISELSGKVSILSGTCYVELDGSCYDKNDENRVEIQKSETLKSDYQGTIITIYIPYDVDTDDELDIADMHIETIEL